MMDKKSQTTKAKKKKMVSEEKLNPSISLNLPLSFLKDVPNIVFINGVHGKGENMISKHDIALSGKRNASKVMNFPPEFETGDGHGINMSLSNSVFNTLKIHSMHESKRHSRLHDKTEKSTTVSLLYIYITQSIKTIPKTGTSVGFKNKINFV